MKNTWGIPKTLGMLSKDEFRDLLLTMMVGNFIRESVAETNGEDWEKYSEQLEILLNTAITFGHEDLVEVMDDGSLLPANDLGLKEDEIMDDFNNDQFWENLEVRLGQKDFFKSLTPEQRKKLKGSWLPEAVHKYYAKYRKEFGKYGLDRLEIVEKGKKIKR